MGKEWVKKHMGIIGSFGQLLFYFQAFNIFWYKSAGEVSLLGFSVALLSLSCWLFYGLIIKNKPLIVANATGLIGAFLVVLGVIIYGS